MESGMTGVGVERRGEPGTAGRKVSTTIRDFELITNCYLHLIHERNSGDFPPSWDF